jgi:hypothetical protein
MTQEEKQILLKDLCVRLPLVLWFSNHPNIRICLGMCAHV